MQPAETTSQRIVHYFGRDTASDLIQQMQAWGIQVCCHHDMAGLMAAVWHTPDSAQHQTSCVFNMAGRTENPKEVIQFLSQSLKLQSIRWILLTPEENPGTHNAQQAGYDYILSTAQGIDYTLLFHALNDHQKVTQQNNVTSLIDGYLRKKTQLPPLEILLAESSPVHNSLIQQLLEKTGHKVYPVTQGNDTLDALYAHDFDCIILNYNTASINGTEICRLHHLSNIGSLRTPIIMTASEITKDIYTSCQQAGATAVLSLPINTSQLFATLNAIYVEYHENARLSEPSYRSFVAGQENRFNNEFDPIILHELEKLGQGVGFVEKIIHHFLTDSLRLLSDSQQAVQTHEWLTFRDNLHNLKGAAGSVGLGHIYHQCLQLTQIPGKQLPHIAQKELSILINNMKQAHKQLNGYINQRRQYQQQKLR